MKHRVKMDVVTEKKGLFGTKKVVEQKMVTVSGREYRQIQQAKRKADDRAKAQQRAENVGFRPVPIKTSENAENS